MNTDGSGEVNITDHHSSDGDPSWSPGGARIAFASYRQGSWGVYVMRTDGSYLQTVIRTRGLEARQPAWAPTTNQLVFVRNRTGNPNYDLYMIRPGGGALHRLTHDPDTELTPALAPRGHKIAFALSIRETLATNIYVMRPNGSRLHRITPGPGQKGDPSWLNEPA